MKYFIITLALLIPSVVSAKETSEVFKTKDGTIQIQVDDSKDYIEIVTRNNISYRVYPCGQLKKNTWKELNPNEDVNTGRQLLFGTMRGGVYYAY